jgi:hypothetical protein
MLTEARLEETMWQDLDVVAVHPSTRLHRLVLRSSAVALALLAMVVVAVLAQEPVAAQAAACDDASSAPGVRLHGRVQDVQTEVRIPGARVLVAVPRTGDTFRRDTLAVTADERGEYELCGLPAASSIRLWSRYEEHRNQSVTVRLDRESVRRNLRVSLGTPARVLLGFSDSEGAPLRDATVLLEPFGIEEETDGDGRVWFQELVPSRYLLTVFKDDWEAAPVVLDVEGGDEVEILLSAVARDGAADTLLLSRSDHDPYLAHVGYYDRLDSGRAGYFLTAEDLASKDHLTLEDVFTFDAQIARRLGRNTIGFLDGREIRFVYPSVRTFLREYSIDGVRALEVHRCAEAPPEYRWRAFSLSDCTVILVWSWR